ncbi:hypothetical protein SALBM311S_05101 [Streptomyces alboniger]
MYSIIVVPPPTTEDEPQHTQQRLAPGERLTFGRSARENDLVVPHDGVSRRAGVISAQGAFWTLSNLCGHQTYVVENPEGAGEHIKVGPGRLDAPVPFEFSRIVLPAAGDLLAIDVCAAPRLSAHRGRPRRRHHRARLLRHRTKRYFAVPHRVRPVRSHVLPTVDCRPDSARGQGRRPPSHRLPARPQLPVIHLWDRTL